LRGPGASVYPARTVGFPLQPRDLLRDVAPQHGRVAPLGLAHRRGHDVLGHRVELVGELALPRGPGRREALVGHPTQKQGVRGEGLVELELVSILAAVDFEAPTAVLEVLAPARVLDHPVERHELRYDDLSHLRPPSRWYIQPIS